MADLLIRNVPDEILAEVDKLAEAAHQSRQQYIISRLPEILSLLSEREIARQANLSNQDISTLELLGEDGCRKMRQVWLEKIAKYEYELENWQPGFSAKTEIHGKLELARRAFVKFDRIVSGFEVFNKGVV